MRNQMNKKYIHVSRGKYTSQCHNTQAKQNVNVQCATNSLEGSDATSTKTDGVSSGKRWECNVATVWGQMCTGGGNTSLRSNLKLSLKEMALREECNDGENKQICLTGQNEDYKQICLTGQNED